MRPILSILCPAVCNTVFALCALACSSAAFSADVPGSSDHPLMSRYTGSYVIGYKSEEFGESDVPLAPAFLKDGRRGFNKTQRVEGRRTRILYNAPPQRSSLEVMRNYKDALSKVGAKFLFECSGPACGPQFASALYVEPGSTHKLLGQQITEYAYSMNTEEERYLAARVQGSNGLDAYVMVFSAQQENAADAAAGKRVATFVEIVESKTMDSGMVTVNADAMRKGLAADGKIALYGIFFDSDKADVKPESKAQLTEMANLLKASPQLKVYIVGHTDNQGSLDHNRTLSQRRADAVARSLSAQYGIDAGRLSAQGIASLAPVANNGSDAGRGKNRRVELVEQ